MSTYATVQGSIRYESPDAFDKAIRLLQGTHLLRDEYMINELGHRISESPAVDAGANTLTIPLSYYRTLIGLLDALFLGGKGIIVWTSTDGIFCGGTMINGTPEEYPLDRWWEDHGHGKVKRPDPESDTEQYIRYQAQVETAFHRYFRP